MASFQFDLDQLNHTNTNTNTNSHHDQMDPFNFNPLNMTNQLSLLDSLNHLDFNPIDPRLNTPTPTPTLNLNHQYHDSDTLTQLDSDQFISTSERATKRIKSKLDHHTYFDFPTTPLDHDQITHWKGLEFDHQIQALLDDSLNSHFLSNNCNPQDILVSKSTTTIGNDHHHPSETPSSISNTIPIDTQKTTQDQNQTCQSSILIDQHCSPSISDSSIDPSLENLHHTSPSIAFPLSSSCQQTLHAGSDQKDMHSNPISHKLPTNSTCASLNLGAAVDVHGAGAGGGAAAVLEAVAAQQQQLKNPSNLTVNWNTDTSIKVKKQVRKRYINKSTKNNQQHGSSDTSSSSNQNNNKFDIRLTSTCTTGSTHYNPDQFRSWNRIHWTKEEEELLLNEVELHWQHYDCMAQIMKRHGPKGTISKTFADRTGVSLKDKAVNISSRWYRDGADINPLTRRAFARFRPKQLRGKPKEELPGMDQLHSVDTSSSSSSHSKIK